MNTHAEDLEAAEKPSRVRDLPEVEALRSAGRWLNGIGLACVAVAVLCAVVRFVTAIGSYHVAAACWLRRSASWWWAS